MVDKRILSGEDFILKWNHSLAKRPSDTRYGYLKIYPIGYCNFFK